MDITGIVSVTAITVICWLIGEIFSNLPIENKWIPSIVGAFGMLLGVVGWLVMPEFPADNILTAFAVGIVSGLASTGADQIYKQMHPSDKGRIIFPAIEEEEAEPDILISVDEDVTATRAIPFKDYEIDTNLRSCFAQDDKPSDGEEQV